jgi:hypothetical protein
VSVPLWAVELAEAFWEAAGMREPFPRSLRRPIARGLPMAVVSLPRLRLRDVRDWLDRNGIGCPCAAEDRNLRACLVAHGGSGYVFLDGSDAEDEQRLSLAHELAHFLRHYWQPRQEACRKLGDRVSEVLDGRRPPTPEERVHAIISGTPIGFHWHLMQRAKECLFANETVAAAEREADRLAYELLAPAEEVFRRAGDVHGDMGRAALSGLLHRDFGLPIAHAAQYGGILLPLATRDSFLQRLGLAY